MAMRENQREPVS